MPRWHQEVLVDCGSFESEDNMWTPDSKDLLCTVVNLGWPPCIRVSLKHFNIFQSFEG